MTGFVVYICQYVLIFCSINIIHLLAYELLKKLNMIHFYFSLDYFLTQILPTIKTDIDKSHYLTMLDKCRDSITDIILLHNHSNINHPRQLSFYNFTIKSIDIMLIELYNHKINK